MLTTQTTPRRVGVATARALCLAAALSLPSLPLQASPIDLADTPVLSTVRVPGNVLLALSVEFPTVNAIAYPAGIPYSPAQEFLGYFDPQKCYRYVYRSPTNPVSFFTPVGPVIAPNNRGCVQTQPLWSGNYLNWASMHALDIFRWTLTGGHRVVDDHAGKTVIEKTRFVNQPGAVHAHFPDKTIPAAYAATATPFGNNAIVSRGFNEGTSLRFAVPGAIGAASIDYTSQSAAAGTFLTAVSYRVQIRVQVCVHDRPGVTLEDNCVRYGSHYKPEGLIQQYADRLRFGALGYLHHQDRRRDGGVLRARLRSIAPSRPGEPHNPYFEWYAATGVFRTNPDSAAAAATTAAAESAGHPVTINRSGVINYLNEFAKTVILPPHGSTVAKRYDPVSELYYAALRYLRGVGNVAAYSNLAGAGHVDTMRQWLDGFPVITNWNNPDPGPGKTYPVEYFCQRNFILGIGDVNTNNDLNLPGSTRTGTEPARPPEVASDPWVNVMTATQRVGNLVGRPHLADQTPVGGGESSYFIAGLAFHARTHDLRPDLPGKQTVSTYWLDVLEWQEYRSRNQFWLAAKFGGLRDVPGFDPLSAATIPLAAWHTTGETVPGHTDLRPDNYFVARNPLMMRQSLERAFAGIMAEVDAQVSTAFATATPRLTTLGAVSYAASFIPKGWTGELNAHALTFAADGTPTLVTPPLWSANALLDARNLTTDPRIIVTCCTSAGAAMPFRASDLAATTFPRTNFASFSHVPGITSQSATDFVAYLRGDRSNEAPKGRGFRARNSLLGTIVGSKANAVGRPNAPFLDAYNPGYSAFRAAHANRRTVVFVGANGGKMHAFDGTVPAAAGAPCPGCGRELFAFIPSFVYGDSTTATTHGLAALGNPNYTHRFFVDATPQVFDVDLNRTGGVTGAAPDWRSVLIGGLGKGGRGYYAIDVTDPSAWTSEAAVASRVLWEFTDPRMGYSFGDASVVKTREHGWVVLLTSGYNNSDGRGYLFLVNPRTGALIEAIATPASAAGPINLAHHAAFVPNFGDFTVDAVYAADLQGNLWRFDLTPVSGASFDPPTLIARLTDAAGVGLPVTVRPLVEIDPASNARHVVVATGRLLADSDIASTRTQSIFVIRDGTAEAGGFFTPATLPTGVSFPVTRAQLNANTSLSTGIGSAPANPMGWFHDLRRAPGSDVAERVNVDLTANAGVVAVGVNLPVPEPCEPGGTGRVLAFSLASGRSVIVDVTGLAESFNAGGFVTDVAILAVGGTTRLYAGTRRGEMRNAPWDLGGALNMRRMNWREVPLAN